MSEKLYTIGRDLAKSTLLSRKSHKKLFLKYGITEETLKNEGVYALDKIKVKGQPLKSGYKAQLAITAKSIYPPLVIDLKNLRQNADKERRILSPDIMDKLSKISEYAANFISGFTIDYPLTNIDLANYEVCTAVLISISTTLRREEIMQLRMIHFDQILQHKAISLKLKQGTSVSLPLNNILYPLIKLVKKHRAEKIRAVKYDTQAKGHQQRLDRIKLGYVILISASYLTRSLKGFAQARKLYNPNDVLGLNLFRNFTTTVCVENGGARIAQQLNRHKTLDTTLNNYAILSTEATEQMYSNLPNFADEQFDEIRMKLDQNIEREQTARANENIKRKEKITIDEKMESTTNNAEKSATNQKEKIDKKQTNQRPKKDTENVEENENAHNININKSFDLLDLLTPPDSRSKL